MSLTSDAKVKIRLAVCEQCLKTMADPSATAEQLANARKELFSAVRSMCPAEAKAWKDKPKAKPKPAAKPEVKPEVQKGNTLVAALPKVKAPKISPLAKFSIFGWTLLALFLYWVFSNMDTIEQLSR